MSTMTYVVKGPEPLTAPTTGTEDGTPLLLCLPTDED